jgi:hypothetical protein
LAYGREHREKLIELMNQKEVVGDVFNQLRLALQRRTKDRAAQVQSWILLIGFLTVSAHHVIDVQKRWENNTTRMRSMCRNSGKTTRQECDLVNQAGPAL